jgi:hypothetical protein
MFALTAHLQDADKRGRQHRNLGIAIVALTGLGAVGAGLAMDALNSLGAFAGLLPGLIGR